MKMLFLVLLLLLNDQDGAHATQGKQTYCVFPNYRSLMVTGVVGEEKLLYENTKTK